MYYKRTFDSEFRRRFHVNGRANVFGLVAGDGFFDDQRVNGTLGNDLVFVGFLDHFARPEIVHKRTVKTRKSRSNY